MTLPHVLVIVDVLQWRSVAFLLVERMICVQGDCVCDIPREYISDFTDTKERSRYADS